MEVLECRGPNMHVKKNMNYGSRKKAIKETGKRNLSSWRVYKDSGQQMN